MCHARADGAARLLGTVENSLGIKKRLEDAGHTVVVTDDKEGPDSVMQKEIGASAFGSTRLTAAVDAEIVVTTPFHPGYLTKEVIAKAKNLKLCVTAGVGSDHVDLNAANERKITVAEVSGSNVVSVAEHVVMTILALVRNFVPAHEMCACECPAWLISAGSSAVTGWSPTLRATRSTSRARSSALCVFKLADAADPTDRRRSHRLPCPAASDAVRLQGAALVRWRRGELADRAASTTPTCRPRLPRRSTPAASRSSRTSCRSAMSSPVRRCGGTL